MRIFLIAATLGALGLPALSIAEVTRGSGDAMAFDIGYGIVVNKESTLVREWVIVADENLPARLTIMRPKTLLDDRNWMYEVEYEVDLDEDILALEVRFIPFDVWGEKDRTLTATHITDMETGSHPFSSRWRILSENNAVEHYAMLGYVAQVKLASGAIVRSDVEAVVEEARRFSQDFASGDLAKEE